MLMLRFIAYLLASILGIWIAWHLSRARRGNLKLLSALGSCIVLISFGNRLLPNPWNLKYEDFIHRSIIPGAVLAFAIPLVGILAADFLSSRVVRFAVLGLMCLAFFRSVWIVALDSMTTVRELSRLHTQFNKNGVCMQTTGYTCGPAAAVTALLRLGISADESDLAIRAETGRYYGTDEFKLAHAMNVSFVQKGLQCSVTDFHDMEEIRTLLPLIVIERLYGNVDHYLVVLGINGESVEYADPLSGIAGHMPRAAFEKDWLKRGITMIRRQ